MTRKVWAEVVVSRTENQRDGQVEGREVARVDVRVLLLKRGKKVCGPRSDSGERLRLGFVAEKLRQKRVDCDSALVCGVHPELAASVREQPQPLPWLGDHRVRKRREAGVGEQPDHLRQT